jgi:hypothetical protein
MRQSPVIDRGLVRERLASAIELFYWALIFEGALRKWFLTALSGPLYFLRDPLTLWIYYMAWKYGFFPKTRLFAATLILMTLFAALGFIQFAAGVAPPEPIIYGWRMYFLFIPLAFVCQKVLQKQDLRRICRRSLIVAIPMAVLVFAQYSSPTNAPINKLLDDESTAFTYAGIARASGTFSFTQGHEYFAVSMLVFLITAWLLPKQDRPMSMLPLCVCTLAVGVNILLNGNRGVLLLSAIIILTSIVYRLFLAGQKITFRTFIPEILILCGAVAYVTLFSSAYEAMSKRVTDGQEDTEARLSKMMLGPFRAAEALPICRVWGQGLAIGTSGGRTLAAKSVLKLKKKSKPLMAESEMPRIILECGPIGMLFILYRIGLFSYLVITSCRISKAAQTPLPVLLTAFVFMPLLEGQISSNGTANGYAWLFTGFALASLNLRRPTPATKPDPPLSPVRK